MESPCRGEVITFYSYKGGTGRSMALANIAGLLTQEGKTVLAIDWDLEAPGLHRYFASAIASGGSKPEDELPGVVDLMWNLCDRFGVMPGMTVKQAQENAQPVEEFDDLAAAFHFNALPLPIDCGKSASGQLHLLKAGSFNQTYSRRVNTLPWEQLFYSAPGLFDAFARYVSARYDYVLIDSRTGLTDISGICTMLMPQKLVTVFTPNRQSLDGVLDLARQAIDYRMTASDMRPFVIFPLASRIDNSETDLRVKWRHGDGTGYQPRFQDLLNKGYGLDDCDLESYFDAAQIPHSARFSYGERIAVLEERVADTLSLAPYYAHFKERLVSDAFPWEDPAAIGSKDAPWELMDRFIQQLPDEERTIIRDTLTRLVRPAGKQEGSDALLVYPVANLPAVTRPLIPRLERANIITVTSAKGTPGAIQLASENMLRGWVTLRDWIDGDRAFLQWRDALRKPIDEYTRDPFSLSSVDPALLASGKSWLSARVGNLTAIEIQFALAAIEEYRSRSARLLCSLAASELQRSATSESAVRSALLAAESLGRLPTVEGDQILRDALAMMPPLLARLENAGAIGFLGTRADRNFVACPTGNQIRFWPDPESLSEPLTFEFERPVTAMASSSDARIIATCDGEGTICIIRDFGIPLPVARVLSGQTFMEFDYEDRLVAVPPTGGVFVIDPDTGLMTCVMPVNETATVRRSGIDRKLFCVAAEGRNECWVWRAGNPGTVQRIPLETPCVTAAFSSDNRQIAVAMLEDADSTVITVYDLDSLAPIVTHRLNDRLNRLIFTPGDLGIVAVTGGRTAQILPVRVKTSAWRARIDSDVCAAAASAHAGLLALGGADGTMRLIDFSSGREVMRADHGAPIHIARFNANGQHLVTAGEDSSVCVWDVRGLREQMRVEHGEIVWDVQFHPSGAQIVTVGNDMVQAREVPSGREFKRLSQFGKTGSSAAFSPDGKKLAVTQTSGEAQVLSWPEGANLARFSHQTASCCTFSPDGSYLATGGWDGLVKLHPQTGTAVTTSFQHSGIVWDVCFHPQSKWLVSADNGGLRIWDIETKTLLRRIAFPAACHACVYSPDGQAIIAACDDGISRILTADGDEDRTIPNGSRINCVAISPDSRHVAVGGEDAVRIWSLISYRPVVNIRYEGEVQWLSFSPDGRYLAVASADTTTRLWLWQTPDLIEETRCRARRALTPEEWALAVPAEVSRLADSELGEEPDLSEMVNPGEMALLLSLWGEAKAEILLNERTYDGLCRLMAIGLIRNRINRDFRLATLSQPIQLESFLDLTPRGREFLHRSEPAAS